MAERMQAMNEVPVVTQNVDCQHALPAQIPLGSGEFAVAIKAYRYENNGVPVKGAYIMSPKLRPMFCMPQRDEMMLGLGALSDCTFSRKFSTHRMVKTVL